MDKLIEFCKKHGIWGAIALILMTLAALLLSSCNVTRTITTESSSYQRGDTTVMITTRTTESYDAVKRGGIR